MEIIFIVALVLVTIVLVGWPLANPEKYRRIGWAAPQGSVQDLYSARDSTFDALRDLQFEFTTGKLSQADYDMLKTRYDLKAAQILQQLDALKPARPAGRAKKAASAGKVCPKCGAESDTSNRFCVRCGGRL
jgi:hypothetical protein